MSNYKLRSPENFSYNIEIEIEMEILMSMVFFFLLKNLKWNLLHY